MITQSININLIPGAVPPRIKVSQYDFGSRTLQFTLFNGTSPFTTASLTARIQGTKPDNKGFSYDATYNAGVVTADVTRQMTACAGAVICELVIVDGSNNELGTGNFILDVEAAALSEDTDISETEIPAIIDAAEANAERAEAAAAIAEAADLHPPYIGENEHWYVWDTVQEQYVDSGVDAEGADGVGIVSIAKTSTVGLVDTYTITLSNGNTSTFTVTNGAEATLPSGGTAGQALIKNSSTASDASWKDISTTGAIKWTQAEGSVKKNLLENKANSTTINGVTFTVNADKSVTVSTGAGGATADIYFDINTAIYLANGVYVFGGAQNNDNPIGTPNAYELYINNVNGVSGWKESFSSLSARTITITTSSAISCKIYVKNGTVISDPVTFYPMIRLASIADSTYAPYIPDNTELVSWEQAQWDVQKNLLQHSVASGSSKGITWTVNADGTITAYGEATARVDIPFWTNKTGVFASGKYILNGCPSGGGNSTYRIQLWDNTAQASYNDTGNGANVSYDATHTTTCQITIFSGANIGTAQNPTVFKPMIRKASVIDPAYAPYVPSNSELQGEIDNALKYIRELTSADNMNDIKDNGIYQIRVSAPTNSPEGKTQCTVFVTSSADGVYTCQIVVRPSDGFIYTRRCLSGSWDGWYKIAGTLVQ